MQLCCMDSPCSSLIKERITVGLCASEGFVVAVVEMMSVEGFDGKGPETVLLKLDP